jgi:ubiquinone/menaquinone biosynthesis C-methylase UbiE
LKFQYSFGPGTVIADIGSGTGIFTSQLLALGATIYAVEPNEDMRCFADERLSGTAGFHSVHGLAEHTTLPDRSVDHVTVAQAFHWFDPVAFKAECRRILKPGGKVFLLWNLRVEDAPVSSRCAEVFTRYCPRFKGYNTGMKAGDRRIAEFFEGRYSEYEFENPLTYDEEHFVERYLSSSYSLRENDANYHECIEEVRMIFRMFEKDGIVTVPNRTYLYAGPICDNPID